MTGAEVALCGYVPAGWPPGTRCVVRRVRIDAEDISGDSRSRRRRSIDPNQLRLVLDGTARHAYAYSFICTNLAWLPVAAEWWFRQRALAEVFVDRAQVVALMPFLGLDQIIEDGESQLVDRQGSRCLGVDVDQRSASGARIRRLSHAVRHPEATAA